MVWISSFAVLLLAHSEASSDRHRANGKKNVREDENVKQSNSNTAKQASEKKTLRADFFSMHLFSIIL